VIHAFPEALPFAKSLGAEWGVRVERVALRRFPDRESLVRVRVQGAEPAVLVRSLDDPNTKLLEVLLAADALRRAGASRVTFVAPYLAYMRQDRVFEAGEPISQRVVGALLGRAFDRVVTVEAHLHRVATLGEVVPGEAESLSAAPALAGWLREHGRGALLVGPDEESAPWLVRLAGHGCGEFRIGKKKRRGDADVVLELPPLPRGTRRAVLVDDIASTGATLLASTQALQRAGVEVVDALVVHALFAEGAYEALRSAGIARIVSTDTIPHASNQIGVAGLVASALNRDGG
jgi:ribose-phosphate pyrophosphokinase